MSTKFIERLHRDQRGTISILTVFAVLLLLMLLGMVMNVGRQVDGKIRVQNSADAAAYSGGVVLARGMNTLTFTNHLLSDVFAITAFLREARDRNSEAYVPEILAAWQHIGPIFTGSGFPKFVKLGGAILQKVPLEQQLVTTYSQWAAAASQQILPLMETILAQELIPKYQRAVVEAFPDIAQMAAMETASRNGQPENGRGKMLGVLWRTSGQVVGGGSEASDPSLPVVDPVFSGQQQYVSTARKQRRNLAHHYLHDWNNEAMVVFDREAKMCQFSALWRSFTCGYLEKLLEQEYPTTNLPHVIRTEIQDVANPTEHLEQNFTFLAVVYWRKVPEMLPGLFRNPMQNDGQAYSEARVFIPRRRLVWHYLGLSAGGPSPTPIGGVPGDFPSLPADPPSGPGGGGPGQWIVGRQGIPTHWDLLNQHWTCQLVPATTANLAGILQTVPPVPDFDPQIALPHLGGLSSQDIQRISPH